MRRPALGLLKLDLKGIIWMSRLVFKFFKDDALLSSLVHFFEREGFDVVGPHDLMPSLLMPAGVMGNVKPLKKDLEAIALGACAAQSHGAQDRGQGVIVSGTKILAKETSKGTNAMLKSAAKKHDVSNAILVKMMKPQQERRVDLPVIGRETIEKLSTYGYKGVSLEAKNGLILEKEAVIKEANEKNIFVYGYKRET
ncbi:MAG: UDP-2,3-diacylglucosamine diphosphatase LpxI [Holosporaceae bacterium]|nr:MAG: UDP-2,3-diacylglucosamine diphosphatase LpxI [Holosporaceae bacterium]